MKPGTAKETAIICAAAVVAVGVLTIPFDLRAQTDGTSSKAFVWLILLAVVALGLVLGFRYLTSRKRAQLELTGTEQYRQLADEYRRLGLRRIVEILDELLEERAVRPRRRLSKMLGSGRRYR
jgi:hypothetical protein